MAGEKLAAKLEACAQPLDSAAIGQHRIDHLERDDAGEFWQVTGRECGVGHHGLKI